MRHNRRGRSLARVRGRNAVRLLERRMVDDVFRALCAAPVVPRSDDGCAILAAAMFRAWRARSYPPAPLPGSVIDESIRVTVGTDGTCHVTADRRPDVVVTITGTVSI